MDGRKLGPAVAVWIGVGVALGIATGNLALWIGLGVAIGVLTGLILGRRGSGGG